MGGQCAKLALGYRQRPEVPSLPIACIYDSELRVMENLNLKGQGVCSQRERKKRNQGDFLNCQKINIKNVQELVSWSSRPSGYYKRHMLPSPGTGLAG